MNIAVYDLVVTQNTRSLNALKNILRKGKTFADQKKIEFSVLLNTRLAPDQFPLTRQIQIACDVAKFGGAKLSGTDAPKMEDNEQTYDDVITRIDKTISFLQTLKPNSFEGYETRKIVQAQKPGMHILGKDYLPEHTLPNVFFHITTAYAILRAAGVELGKADFLGEQTWKAD